MFYILVQGNTRKKSFSRHQQHDDPDQSEDRIETSEDNTRTAPICSKDQFQCWWENKQKLNENIARVCRKYGDFIDKISGRVLDRSMFIQYDNMVYCIIQKVRCIVQSFWYILFLKDKTTYY